MRTVATQRLCSLNNLTYWCLVRITVPTQFDPSLSQGFDLRTQWGLGWGHYPSYPTKGTHKVGVMVFRTFQKWVRSLRTSFLETWIIWRELFDIHTPPSSTTHFRPRRSAWQTSTRTSLPTSPPSLRCGTETPSSPPQPPRRTIY